MNVVLASDHRFDRIPDGAVWTQTMYAYSYWRIYLDVFDHVRVVARVREVPSALPDWKQAYRKESLLRRYPTTWSRSNIYSAPTGCGRPPTGQLMHDNCLIL